jgi:hypothetical protein
MAQRASGNPRRESGIADLPSLNKPSKNADVSL